MVAFFTSSLRKCEGVLLGLGHLVVELPGGVGWEAEESGAFGAKLGEAGDDGGGVVGAAGFGAAPGEVEEGFAGVAVGEGVEEVLLGGVLDGEGPALRGLRDLASSAAAAIWASLRPASARYVLGDEEGFFCCGEDFGDECGGEG